MIAIRTKYLGPTETKGARVVADDGRGHRITVAWDYTKDVYDMHEQVAKALCKKYNWPTKVVGGDLGEFMVWVFIPTGGESNI